MTSFLKFICPLETSDTRIQSWYKDPFETFLKSTMNEQLKFLYGQAISINYLNRVYDHDLPYFISLMKNEFTDIFFPCFAENIKFVKDPADKFLVQQHFEIIKWLFGGQQYNKEFLTKFDIGAITDILRDVRYSNTPVPCTTIFYESYLMFLQEVFNRAFGLTTCTGFHVNGLIALPQFTINNCMLIEHDVVVSESYNYSYEDNQIFGTNPLSLGVTSIFAFWRGYNWKHLSFDSVVSILATYGALELQCSSDNSLKRAYYDVYQLMNPMSTSANLKPSICHNAVLNFLVDIFRRFNTKSVDKVMMDQLFYTGNVEATNTDGIVTKKLREEMDSLFEEVAEANEAFQSTLRNLGVDKMSSGSLPMFVEDANLVSKLFLDAGKKEEDQENDLNNPDQDQKKDSKNKNDPESPDENQQAANATEDNSENETDQKEEQPNQESNPSLDQEGKKPEEEEPASVDEANSNDETNKDTKKTDEEEQTQTHTGSHTSLPKPRIPGMSLKRGIKLELANDDETIDSFLYRKEVGSFIDDIVSNPNHDFSVQQIQAFKVIKSRLLWTLNVQSLYNLLKEISKA